MALREEFEATGNWLFCWRSYLPILLFVPLFLGILHHDWPFHSYQAQQVWEVICLSVSLLGLTVRVITVGHAPSGTSGRNTTGQVADSLNTTGIYATVRHPLYVGNFLMWLGIAMLCFDWKLIVMFVLAFYLYYERIMFAEEEFLRKKFGREFEQWAARTPAFIPRPTRWVKPSLPFSLRSVLRREYSSFLAMVVAFVAVVGTEHWLVEREVTIEPYWLVFAGVSVLIYLSLRTLKKHSMVLNVEGR